MTTKVGVLYVCYLSIDEPLVETQVVAYLRGLATDGHRIHLVTFDTRAVGRRERRAHRARLARDGITLHHLRYHKRLSMVATAFDVVAGSLFGAWLCLRHSLRIVHARNHVSGAMALAICSVAGRQMVFDVRGIMAEEYEDAGIWKRNSLAFRITKWVEKACFARAAGVIVLTERIREQLGLDAQSERVKVIPSCVDFARIENSPNCRQEVRSLLGLEDRTVMIYLGKFGGWYMGREMVEFFRLAQKTIPDLFFLIVSQSDADTVRGLLADVDPTDFLALRAAPDEVSMYLAAADFGVSFIRPLPSKVSSSPTKVGEYLAAGLPIVSSSGVGDTDSILQRYNTGVLVPEFAPSEYARAARSLQSLLAMPDIAARCRRTAAETSSLRDIGIPAYRDLYSAVVSAPPEV